VIPNEYDVQQVIWISMMHDSHPTGPRTNWVEIEPMRDVKIAPANRFAQPPIETAARLAPKVYLIAQALPQLLKNGAIDR